MNTHNHKRKNYRRKVKPRYSIDRKWLVEFEKETNFLQRLNKTQEMVKAAFALFMRDRHPITGELLDSE